MTGGEMSVSANAYGRYVIGEAKGGDIGKAVSQLDKTATALLAKQGDVKFSAEVILKKGQKLGDEAIKPLETSCSSITARNGR